MYLFFFFGEYYLKMQKNEFLRERSNNKKYIFAPVAVQLHVYLPSFGIFHKPPRHLKMEDLPLPLHPVSSNDSPN